MLGQNDRRHNLKNYDHVIKFDPGLLQYAEQSSQNKSCRVIMVFRCQLSRELYDMSLSRGARQAHECRKRVLEYIPHRADEVIFPTVGGSNET